MARDPRDTTKDAQSSTAEQLTVYETAIVSKFMEEAVMPEFIGFEKNWNIPGLVDLEWKVNRQPSPPDTSQDGNEGAGSTDHSNYDVVTNKFVVTDKSYEISYYDLERAKRSGYELDTQSAEDVGQVIAQTVDYNLMNGWDTPVMDGLLETAVGQDVGAPSGIWDVAGKAYTDWLVLIGKIRATGYAGAINAVCTPGIKVIEDYFVDNGTQILAKTYGEWFRETLNGKKGEIGKLLYSSYPFTALTGPKSTDLQTGTTGTAVNKIVMAAQGVLELHYAHGLQSNNQPIMESNIKRNVRIKYSIKTKDATKISWMDAIDMVT